MRKTIFVNLKRFDIPVEAGGICPGQDSDGWARSIIEETVRLDLPGRSGMRIVYFFPQSLLVSAREEVRRQPASAGSILLGCQGVFREDVSPGSNFGAFTTNLPASAAAALGCSWALIGHSEERKDKFDLLASYDEQIIQSPEAMKRANAAIDRILNQEARRAFEAGMNVLFCVGETTEERGGGSFEEQKPRIEAVLRNQVEQGLDGLAGVRKDLELVIGYEPRWAIGPGKIPPGASYIAFVSSLVKSTARQLLGVVPDVVYGGGLKIENAKEIASVGTIDGGLVALTRFTAPVGFSPEGLGAILDEYHSALSEA